MSVCDSWPVAVACYYHLVLGRMIRLTHAQCSLWWNVWANRNGRVIIFSLQLNRRRGGWWNWSGAILIYEDGDGQVDGGFY